MDGYFSIYPLFVLGNKSCNKLFKSIEIFTLLLENMKFKRMENNE